MHILLNLKLFSYEDVNLIFEEPALRAIAKEAIKRNTGARGLRGVIESAMLEIMYEIPSKTSVKDCIITEDVIKNHAKPELVFGREKPKSEKSAESDSAESA